MALFAPSVWGSVGVEAEMSNVGAVVIMAGVRGGSGNGGASFWACALVFEPKAGSEAFRNLIIENLLARFLSSDFLGLGRAVDVDILECVSWVAEFFAVRGLSGSGKGSPVPSSAEG